jgi:hypothetical protein
LLVTGIIRAGIAVIANQWHPGQAQATTAGIIDSTGVLIATWSRVVNVVAAACWQADIIGTRILVVTVERCRRNTKPLIAVVARSASVAVIAGGGVGDMGAA